MVSDELLNYIEDSIARGHSKRSIRKHLVGAGWPKNQIDAAFEFSSKGADITVPKFSDSAKSGSQRFFGLQEGEKIVFETKPLKGLFWSMFLSSLVAVVFAIPIIIFLLLPVFITSSSNGMLTSSQINSAFAAGVMGAILLLFLSFFIVKRMYNMRYYWITNKRIIIKTGFLGYTIKSIPFERISDVQITRTFTERIFGFGSLYIQSLAGQFTQGRRFGSEGNLTAVPEPERIQYMIFRLIKEKRTKEHITM